MKPLKIGRFTMDVPIVQGGMGVGVSLGNLAGNVAKCGGVGTISSVGIGFNEEDYYKNPLESNKKALKKQVDKARKISNGNGMIALNIMQAISDFEEFTKYAITTGIDALVVGAGLPLKLPKLLENSDVLLAPIVSSKRALDVLIRSWTKKFDRLPDFVVLEGKGAGGHLGYSIEELQGKDDLEERLLEILKFREEKNYNFPIIVGGTINSPEDVKKFLDLGADGVQVGTRFIATHECDSHENFKNAIVNATEDDLEIVYSPVGMPGRAIRNNFIKRVSEEGRIKPTKCTNCLVPCNPKETKYCISEALMKSVRGDVDNGLIFSGSGVKDINKIQSVCEVIEYLTRELD